MSESLPSVSITVAPNGGRRGKADHPALPLTPAELARCAARSAEAGAAMIHVHVRDAAGRHLLDADAYGAAIAAIRAEAGEGMIIQITSESLGLYDPAAQIAVVREVRPEAVSLALRELLPEPRWEPAFADALAWMRSAEILPQIILYEPSELVWLESLRRRGLIPWEDVPVLLALGRYTTAQTARPADLLPFLAPDIPRPGHWTVCAFGRLEAPVVTAGALLGGQVRVGFENNLHLPDGRLAACNAELVRAVARILGSLGLDLETGATMRARLTK